MQSFQYLLREELRGEWSELSAKNFYNLPRILIALFFSTRVATLFFRRPIFLFELLRPFPFYQPTKGYMYSVGSDLSTFIAKQLPGLDKSYIIVSDTIKLRMEKGQFFPDIRDKKFFW